MWVDIYGGKVFENDLRTGEQTVTDVGTMVGAVAPRADQPGFVAAVADGFGFIVDGELTIVDRVLPEPELRMNDGKVDSRGRFWAGSNEMAFQPGQARVPLGRTGAECRGRQWARAARRAGLGQRTTQ